MLARENLKQNSIGNDTIAPMQALLEVNFTLFGTEFVAEWVRKENGGFSVLLMPTNVVESRSIKIRDVIAEIKRMIRGEVDTSQLKAALDFEERDGSYEDIEVSLAMAYLKLDFDGSTQDVEYAFQFKVLTENLISDGLKELAVVKNAGVAIWNTKCDKILSQMKLNINISE